MSPSAWRSFCFSRNRSISSKQPRFEAIGINQFLISTTSISYTHYFQPTKSPTTSSIKSLLPKMTTYAAFSNLSSPTASIYHRKPSTASASSQQYHNTNTTPLTPHNTKVHNSPSHKGKWYDFLKPTEDPTLSPGLLYDPVIRRPLFARAKEGNERSLGQERDRKRSGVYNA
jgi:hypothetical protein